MSISTHIDISTPITPPECTANHPSSSLMSHTTNFNRLDSIVSSSNSSFHTQNKSNLTPAEQINFLFEKYREYLENPLAEKPSIDLLQKLEPDDTTELKYTAILEADRFLPPLNPLCDNPIPKTIRTIALSILSGAPNPFDNITVIRTLGSGVSGSVSLVETEDGKKYAMKTFHHNCTESFTKEHLNLTPLPHHEHFTEISYIDPINQAIFFEYMENGTLENIETKLSPTELLNVLSQVCNALHFMHTELYAVHADIKMDNIFIDDKKNIKLGDFGLSKLKYNFEPYHKRINYHHYYHLPPEFSDPKLTGKDADKMDVWSFGVLIWELLRNLEKKLPFEIKANPINQTVSLPLPEDLKALKSTSIPLPEDFKGFDLTKLKASLSESKVHTLDPTGQLTSIMANCLQPLDKRPSMLEIKELIQLIPAPIEASHA